MTGAVQNFWNIADYFTGNVENILETLRKTEECNSGWPCNH